MTRGVCAALSASVQVSSSRRPPNGNGDALGGVRIMPSKSGSTRPLPPLSTGDSRNNPGLGIMPKDVRCHPLVDLESFGGLAKDPMKLTGRDGQQGVTPGEQPRARFRHPPVVAQDRQQTWREHCVAVLPALALLDA